MLDEQIERARQVLSRIDADYYFTNDKIGDEALTSAQRRPWAPIGRVILCVQILAGKRGGRSTGYEADA